MTYWTVDLEAYVDDELPEQCGRHGVGFVKTGETWHVDVYRYVGTMSQLVSFLDDCYGPLFRPDLTTEDFVRRFGTELSG